MPLSLSLSLIVCVCVCECMAHAIFSTDKPSDEPLPFTLGRCTLYRLWANK